MRALRVSIKSEQDIEKLRISGRLAAQVLQMIGEYVKPGVTTEYLDDLCHDYIVNTLKVVPANVGYHGYTKTTCISPNEVVCHGIPSSKTILKDGDIINIDVAVIKDGYYGDTRSQYSMAKLAVCSLMPILSHTAWASARSSMAVQYSVPSSSSQFFMNSPST